jgi:hypothetical protein
VAKAFQAQAFPLPEFHAGFTIAMDKKAAAF